MLGLLEHAATYVLWAKFLFYVLRHSMILAIRKNKQVVFRNSRFRDLIRNRSCEDESPDNLLKKDFAHIILAKNIWNCPHLHFITQSLRMELKFLDQVLTN